MSTEHWPGYTGKCNPEIWNERARLPPVKEKKIGQITEEQIDEYFREGVVLIENYFTSEELDSMKTDIQKQVNFLGRKLLEKGEVKSTYEEYGFFKQLTMLNKDFPGATTIFNKLGITPQAVRDIWSGDKLCNMVEQLIGPDFGGHPVWNLRSKTPNDEQTTVPWHQDCAYLDTTTYDKHQPSVWIPLIDATPTNGCLEFAVGGHKKGKIANHTCCEGDTHYVMLDLEEMRKDLDVDLQEDIKLFPVKFGSMLLFNNCIPHRSLDNVSGFPGEIRWSLDIRYQDYRKEWGFHGLADGIIFRKGDDPEWRPQTEDWDNFLKLPNISKYRAELNDEDEILEAALNDAFTLDTTVTGPWMRNWELTHLNRNTDGLSKETTNWHNYTVK